MEVFITCPKNFMTSIRWQTKRQLMKEVFITDTNNFITRNGNDKPGS